MILWVTSILPLLRHKVNSELLICQYQFFILLRYQMNRIGISDRRKERFVPSNAIRR